ncbi:MAG: HAMP domain-containing histidine kinase [Deltaproteobacteria bacterium]|nr:HAMP domain-containing histidine kinase [Deltaproteobacteria bacterium]
MLVVTGAAIAPLAIITFSDAENWPVRLTIAVIGGAALVAWWLGWRMVTPLRQLQRQAREQAGRAAPGGGEPSEHALLLDREDEFGDLAAAFNALLAALERRKRTNEAFVADLVHEVKNPVAAVRAAADALERGTVDRQRAARLARVLRDSSTRLDHVASRFLELARAEAGLPAEERVSIPAHAVVRAVVRAHEASVDVPLSCTCEEIQLVAVPSAFEAAVRNLLENATSFAPRGEGAPTVEVRLQKEGRHAVLRVVDSGPGIAAEDLPHVFERFFTKRRTGEGTGLGLALVRAVAESHGGTASVTSTPGQGAAFRLELPL